MTMRNTKAALQALERSYALCDAGDQIAALDWADRALKLDPDLAAGHTQRGWILENLGSVRLPEARIAYERALELEPADLWAALGLATVLTRLGSAAEARELYRRVVEEAAPRLGEEPDLHEALGWAQHRLGLRSEAEATLRAALALRGDDVAARLDLAIVLLVAGKASEGLAELARAVGDATPRDRGNLAVALDDLEGALVEHHGLEGGETARAMLAEALGAAPAAGGGG
jgi:tetratricopeptide (TPR) repeat protein